jgi:lysophospholipase L1-like esterase
MGSAVPNGRRGQWLRAPLLLLGAVAGTLLALECGVRAASRVSEARSLASARARQPDARGEVELGDLVRPHPDPDLIYELRPGLSTQFRGARVRTDSHGFRGPEPAAERGPDAARIFGIGDSVMFGWGVPEEATFLARLAARLNAEHPARRWEAINAAVPGYNTVMEVATLREKGLRLAPDLVVIDYVQNDVFLPHFLLEREDWWDPRRSFLAELVARRLDAGPWLPAAHLREASPWWGQRQPDRVPARHAHLVGWDAYARALDELAALAREHGFEVVVSCASGDLLGRARKRIERHGFPIANPRPAQERLLASLGNPPRWRSPLAQSQEDPHPTALAHQLAADALHDALVASGALARLEAGAR